MRAKIATSKNFATLYIENHKEIGDLFAGRGDFAILPAFDNIGIDET